MAGLPDLMHTENRTIKKRATLFLTITPVGYLLVDLDIFVSMETGRNTLLNGLMTSCHHYVT